MAPVFPGASGFASAAPCGTGFPIYRVTNLNDSGPGSLRQGASVGKCMIVFEVGGAIVLSSDLAIASNVTIAGETAPPPGITIQKREFTIRSSNVRVRHVTFQRGYDPTNLGNADVGKVAPGHHTAQPSGKVTCENIHFHHCAFYWGTDETVEHWPANSRILRNVSHHDCIFAEPLYRPSRYDATLKDHVKVQSGQQTGHNYGVLIGYGTKPVDMQYCLFSDMDMREPFCDASTDIVLANLIANNTTKGATIQQNGPWSGTPEPGPYRITCKGYLCISGPNSGKSWYSGFIFNSYRNPQPPGSKVFVSNLYGWKGGPSTSTYVTPGTEVRYADKVNGCYWLDGETRVGVRVNTPPIDTPKPTVALGAQQIYDRAVRNCGPRPADRSNTTLPYNKDVARTITNLKNKTGKWINHEAEVGGFYSPAMTERKLDGTTSFSDGTVIPVPPEQPQPATTASRTAMSRWLTLFLQQVQLD